MRLSLAQNGLPQYNPATTMPHPPANGNSLISWASDTHGEVGRRSSSDESTPLLFESASRASQKRLDVEIVRDEIEDNQGKLIHSEFVKILKMSGPVIFAYMLQNSLQTGSVLVVGRMVCHPFLRRRKSHVP